METEKDLYMKKTQKKPKCEDESCSITSTSPTVIKSISFFFPFTHPSANTNKKRNKYVTEHWNIYCLTTVYYVYKECTFPLFVWTDQGLLIQIL